MKTLLGVLGTATFVVFAGLARAEDAPNPELLRKQLLEKFDANGDGNLTGQELIKAQEAVMKQAGDGPPGAAFEQFKQRFDFDRDGKLNAQEQAAAMAAFQKARANGGAPGTGALPAGGFDLPAAGDGAKPRSRDAMIKRFDRNGDGKLDDQEKAEAQKVLKARKGEGKPSKLTEAMKEFDADGDGKLSDEEKAEARKELAEKRKGKKPE